MSDKAGRNESRVGVPVADTLIGKVLGGRYRIDTLLGSGAVGRVYAAEHVSMHKPLAVKILHPEHAKNRQIVARFEREATAAANIDHANVVAALDFGTLEDGTVYLALELAQGTNLRAEIAKGPLGVRRALHIMQQAASGLAAAHARNVVHRDLKPENIVLVEKDGDPDFVKLLDFGIAKLTESGKSPLTQLGVVLGTFDYMAPEQALGQELDARADLYALGVLTYEMLCGARPFEGESASAILELQLGKRPPSFRERDPRLAVPSPVEALVMQLLSKEKNDRPAGAPAVVARVADLLLSLPPETAAAHGPATPAQPAPRPPIQYKPTFLPSDPLPQFTFPPLEEESKKLTAEVQAALAARATAPPPNTVSTTGDATAPPPVGSPGAVASPSSVASPSAAQKVRLQAGRVMEMATGWVEDRRRALPRLVRRPLRRVSARALLWALLAFVAVVISVLVLLVARPRNEPPASVSRAVPAAPPPASAAVVAPAPSTETGVAAIARAETELKAGNWAGVVVALEEALEADPAAKRNERVAVMLGEATRRSASSNTAFRLLSGPMGEKGAEVLYDVAANPKTPADLRSKTEAWLGSEQFRRVASAELSIAAQLRTARACKDKHALLPTAANTGDRRALEYLKVLAIEGGCGRRGREDCFPCLRDDDALANAIAKLEQGSAKASP